MSTPWIVAFCVLAGGLALLTVTVIGLMRRVIPILEQLEGQTDAQPGFGLTVGSVVEPFELYTRRGERIEWDDFVERPTIILLVAAGCQPCRELPSKLHDVDNDIAGVPFLVVANDAADETARELERRWRVLYEKDDAATHAFKNQATPQAYFVDQSGLVLARAIPRLRRDLVAMIDAKERSVTLSG
ncbi:MAG TPA: hypothetical protein VF101_07005 [Gaiellaceae bacterium]